MATQYSYRPYQNGDAAEINRLYQEIIGRSRKLSEFEWQWLDAPGGRGEIWLIEATESHGKPKLIGHHGLMPIRFTDGDQDLLFGKTENTMVLPEYRSRILYPRFERRFASNYESRFDMLFSTMGPPEAIRQRRALGYEFSTKWLQFRIPTSRLGAMRLLYRALLNRIFGQRASDAPADEGPQKYLQEARSGSPLPLRALDDDVAKNDAFFDSFWPNCRTSYGLTARRDRDDLGWRFWSNPYAPHITLVSDTASDNVGYVIIKRNKRQPMAAAIEDIVPGKPTAANFARLLDSALSWMHSNSISWVDLSTTDDSGIAAQFASVLNSRDNYSRNRPVAIMPRKLTSSGEAKGLGTDGWYITPIVFEGRSD